MASQLPRDIHTRTPIYRMVHIDCLPTLLARATIHAPTRAPDDGRPYQSIHADDVRQQRAGLRVPFTPRSTIGDFVGFYLGPRSPMLYRIHTGWNVQQCDQANIVYLVTTAQSIANAGLRFVFTDRHSLAAVAAFFEDLGDLHRVDFATTYATQWNTTADHPDRQEKKQAEFLVHEAVPWPLIQRIGVSCAATKRRVETMLSAAGAQSPPVRVERGWYY